MTLVFYASWANPSKQNFFVNFFNIVGSFFNVGATNCFVDILVLILIGFLTISYLNNLKIFEIISKNDIIDAVWIDCQLKRLHYLQQKPVEPSSNQRSFRNFPFIAFSESIGLRCFDVFFFHLDTQSEIKDLQHSRSTKTLKVKYLQQCHKSKIFTKIYLILSNFDNPKMMAEKSVCWNKLRERTQVSCCKFFSLTSESAPQCF